MDQVWVAKWEYVEQQIPGSYTPDERDAKIASFRHMHDLPEPREVILRVVPDIQQVGVYGARPA
jgi:hypothetical protein